MRLDDDDDDDNKKHSLVFLFDSCLENACLLTRLRVPLVMASGPQGGRGSQPVGWQVQPPGASDGRREFTLLSLSLSLTSFCLWSLSLRPLLRAPSFVRVGDGAPGSMSGALVLLFVLFVLLFFPFCYSPLLLPPLPLNPTTSLASSLYHLATPGRIDESKKNEMIASC